jgi:peptide/nickel transport system permease protein
LLPTRCSISAILDSARIKLPGILLSLVIAAMLLAGFLAPYSFEIQNRQFAFVPPTRIHFFDGGGSFHLRPFVYANQQRPYPIHFLAEGSSYRLLGIVPSTTHLFGVTLPARIFVLGTDALGRDVLTRLLYGGQISLLAGLAAAITSVLIGLLLGGLSGYYGGWLDSVLMRLAEVFLSVPWLYLLLAIRALLPLSLHALPVFLLLMAVAGLIGWGRPARLIRGIVLGARNREYVQAARGFGASDWYILRRHVLPEAYGVAVTQAAIYIPQYVTAEVTLSFFGLGVSEPEASWGNMLAQLRSLYVLQNCWWMFAPAAALVLVLLIAQWFFRVKFRRFHSDTF